MTKSRAYSGWIAERLQGWRGYSDHHGFKRTVLGCTDPKKWGRWNSLTLVEQDQVGRVLRSATSGKSPDVLTAWQSLIPQWHKTAYIIGKIDLQPVSSRMLRSFARLVRHLTVVLYSGPVDVNALLAATEPHTVRTVRVYGSVHPEAQPIHSSWVRDIRDKCQAAGVEFQFGGWGTWCVSGQMPDDQPHPVSESFWLDPAGERNMNGVAFPPWENVIKTGYMPDNCLLDGRRWPPEVDP